MSMKCLSRHVLAGLLSGALVACGGGDGAGAEEPQPSQTQARFDEATLATKGGAHQLVVAHTLNPEGPTVNWVTTTSLRMDRSPFQQQAGATATAGAPELLLQAGAGGPNLDFSDNAGQAVIASGTIHFMRSNAPSTVRHQGDDVIIETKSSDGEYTRRERITAVTKHELRGRLDTVPEEFRASYRTVVEALRGGVRFPDGAAYYKRTSVRVGALLLLQDADGNSATDPQSATEFMTGTIEDAPPRMSGLDLRDGTIRRVNGVRCWVRTRAHETVWGATAFFLGDPTFAVLCEVGGKVYMGSLQPDGAVLGSMIPTSTTLERVPYTIRLNQAAVDGLRSMVP